MQDECSLGDRPVGLVGSQSVYEHADRDVTVDTTASSPEECAETIVRRLDSLASRKAFDESPLSARSVYRRDRHS